MCCWWREGPLIEPRYRSFRHLHTGWRRFKASAHRAGHQLRRRFPEKSAACSSASWSIDNDRGDALREGVREDDFRNAKGADGRVRGELTNDEVWKKPPIPLAAYPAM